ncbi:MAG: class I SAM-dependent methyltransferase [Acidimicrobiales bacterium]
MPSKRGPIPDAQRWNHNIEYHRLVLDAIPEGCGRALDLGCGDGMLARAMSGCAAEVVGVDLDAGSIQQARAQTNSGVTFVEGDAMTADLGTFDFVGSIATRVLSRRRGGYWEHGAAIQDPSESHVELRRASERIMPGSALRRLVLFRYVLRWTKPPTPDRERWLYGRCRGSTQARDLRLRRAWRRAAALPSLLADAVARR